MKKLFPFILALALLLTGCAGEPNQTTPQKTDTSPEPTAGSTPESTKAETEPTAPSGIELTGYTVIYPSGTGPLTVLAAKQLAADLSAKGASIAARADSAPPTDKEILIGETNREESSAEYATGLGYEIRKSGDKILILSSAEVGITFACSALTERVVSEDGKPYIALDDGITAEIDIDTHFGTYIAADQKNASVTFFDIGISDLSTATASKSFQFERGNIAGLKLRIYNGKKVLLAAYGSRFSKMLDIETGEVLWFCDSVGRNPHSVELTPNGVIAVASSNGNCVNFYSATDVNKMLSVTLDDAHGVLYDPDTELVFAVGLNKLRAFSVGLDENGDVTVKEDVSRAKTLPSNYAHDLQPVYGNTDRFWITTSSSVYQYSVSENKIYTNFDGRKQLLVNDIKGIGNFENGSIMYVTPDGKFETWTSESVYLCYKYRDQYAKYKISFDTVGIYKLRVAYFEYQ